MDVIGILDYLVGFAIMAGIYGVFAVGLNVHWGFTGLFNIGIAGFFALGAYTSALLTTPPPELALVEDFKFGGNWAGTGFLDLGFDLWFFLAIAAAAMACGAIALVIGYVTLRLRDDYLAIATLGIAETVRLVFLNEKWVANGSKGPVPDTAVLRRPGAAGKLRLSLSARSPHLSGVRVSRGGACGQFPLGGGSCGPSGKTKRPRRPAAKTCPGSSCRHSFWAR